MKNWQRSAERRAKELAKVLRDNEALMRTGHVTFCPAGPNGTHYWIGLAQNGLWSCKCGAKKDGLSSRTPPDNDQQTDTSSPDQE